VVLTYLGEGSFRLQSGEISLLVDPPNNRLKADVVLKTAAALPLTGETEKQDISLPGEYEIKGIEINGIAIARDDSGAPITVYLVRWEGIVFGILTRLTKIPDAGLLEKLNEPDVIFLQVGKKFLAVDAAEKVMRQIEPKLVAIGCASPAEVLKSFGEKGEPQEKIVFRRKDVDAIEGMNVVVLKAS
jgi:hypothetical protein